MLIKLTLNVHAGDLIYNKQLNKVINIMYGYGRGFGHGHFWAGGMICMLIVFVLLIALVIFLVLKNKNIRNNIFNNGSNKYQIDTNSNNRALEILNEKFAQGDITEEEYLHKKELISK